ncbi:MAG TPA: nuclear transport factor 2 family protein [Rubrivivax sp.]|jgi:ketosteroid isomerase-like protein|nr:nuclear transport factor 2 family protein [Rubrivivax sp.]
MTSALETVQQIYSAFGRGDIPAILGAIDEDVKWEAWQNNTAQAAGVPWLKGGSGKAAVAEFFGVVGQMKFNDFRVLGMMASDSQVAVEVVLDATLPSGKRVQDEEVHLWTVNAAGRVTRMRHYLDTAKHIAAAQA